MKTATKYFGEIEYEREDVLDFPKGLFGFEQEREFLLLPFAGGSGLFCLQSLATPGLAFVAVDPFAVCEGYAPILEEDQLTDLDAQDSHELLYFALCAVKDPVANSTVNLKCPIAVNDESRIAAQVILEDSPYGMRHLLSDIEKEAEKC